MDKLSIIQVDGEALRQKLRMIVAHATGGHLHDIDLPVNDICCEISRNRNAVYQAGKDSAAGSPAELRAALERVVAMFRNTMSADCREQCMKALNGGQHD